MRNRLAKCLRSLEVDLPLKLRNLLDRGDLLTSLAPQQCVRLLEIDAKPQPDCVERRIHVNVSIACADKATTTKASARRCGSKGNVF